MKTYVNNPKRIRRVKYAYLRKIGCSVRDARRLKDYSDDNFPSKLFKL